MTTLSVGTAHGDRNDLAEKPKNWTNQKLDSFSPWAKEILQNSRLFSSYLWVCT